MMLSGCCPIWLAERKRQTACSDQRCGLLALVFPVMSVASQSVDLELLEHLGVIQRQELVLDALSKSSIELTIKSRIIPPCVGRMFRELNHVFVDMLMVVHLECV